MRTVFDTGTRSLWPYLRIAILAALLIAGGGRLVVWVFEQLGAHGESAGWTAKTLALTLPITRDLLLLIWASLVGVFVWWSRVIVVTDGRAMSVGSSR